METRKLIVILLNVLSLSFLLPPELQSQSTLFRVRKEDSLVGFSVYKWGVFKEEGRFKDFDGTVEFDPGNPAATKVDFAINASSVDSRNPDRDGALRSQEFLHVTRYPNLRFTGNAVREIDKSTMLVGGDLTIRGVTRHVEFPVKISGVHKAGGQLGTLVGFESTFTINREDFKVAERWDIIGKEVTIHLLIGAGSGSATAVR